MIDHGGKRVRGVFLYASCFVIPYFLLNIFHSDQELSAGFNFGFVLFSVDIGLIVLCAKRLLFAPGTGKASDGKPSTVPVKVGEELGEEASKQTGSRGVFFFLLFLSLKFAVNYFGVQFGVNLLNLSPFGLVLGAAVALFASSLVLRATSVR